MEAPQVCAALKARRHREVTTPTDTLLRGTEDEEQEDEDEFVYNKGKEWMTMLKAEFPEEEQ